MRRLSIWIISLLLLPATAAFQKPDMQDVHLRKDIGLSERTEECDTLITYDVFKSFEMTANGNGVIEETVGFDVTTPPDDHGAYSADWYRDVLVGGGSVLNLPNGMQVAGGWYFIVADLPSIVDHQSAVRRWTRDGTLLELLRGNTYEMRFTEGPNHGIMWYTTETLVDVPFELWYLSSTPSDLDDDVRMIPWLYDDDANDQFNFKLDHSASDGKDDPYSDWIYWVLPEDKTPGESGYEQFVEAAMNGNYEGEGEQHWARLILMNWDRHQHESSPGAGDGPIDAVPEIGTIFRMPMYEEPVPIDTTIACRVVIDINRWKVFLWANGVWAMGPLYGPGGEWPKGSDQFLIFAAGHSLGTLKNGVPSASIVEYGCEYQPGDILNVDPQPIDSLIASDPNDPSNRVYVIDRTMSGPDWEEWPVDKGAPVDENGNPLLISDQDSWTIFNDIDPNLHWGTSEPILGVEVQRSTYGWAADRPLADVFFVKWIVTNKCDTSYPDTYFGIWMDPDLDYYGNWLNDLVGIDTLTSLAYIYNADDSDAPVALGVDFLKGPEDELGQSLPLTAFAHYISGTDPDNDEEQYNYLRGYDINGNPKPWGPFDFSGDPVTGTGHIDTLSTDKRILLSSGPFTLNPGESKEIIAACIGALGADRLDAITQVRAKDEYVQSFYDANLAAGIEDQLGAILQEPFVLRQNYPNPFNPRTTIRYLLRNRANVDLEIYNILGQRIRRLVRARNQVAGQHHAVWDGKDESGREVPSGVYMYRLKVGGDTWVSRSMMLLK